MDKGILIECREGTSSLDLTDQRTDDIMKLEVKKERKTDT